MEMTQSRMGAFVSVSVISFSLPKYMAHSWINVNTFSSPWKVTWNIEARLVDGRPWNIIKLAAAD